MFIELSPLPTGALKEIEKRRRLITKQAEVAYTEDKTTPSPFRVYYLEPEVPFLDSTPNLVGHIRFMDEWGNDAGVYYDDVSHLNGKGLTKLMSKGLELSRVLLSHAADEASIKLGGDELYLQFDWFTQRPMWLLNSPELESADGVFLLSETEEAEWGFYAVK